MDQGTVPVSYLGAEHNQRGEGSKDIGTAALSMAYNGPNSARDSSFGEEDNTKAMSDGKIVDTSSEPNPINEGADSRSLDSYEPVQESLSKITQQVQGLPAELQNMIMKELWETAFCPGFVYPHRHLNHEISYECDRESRCAARPELLSVCRSLRDEYQVRFWTENTFVIDTGLPSFSTDFLNELPHEVFSHINKIDLTFTVRDLSENYATCLPIDHPGWEPSACQSRAEYYASFLSGHTYLSMVIATAEDDTLDEESSPERSDGDDDEGTESSHPKSASALHNHAIDASFEERRRQEDEQETFELGEIWLDKFYAVCTLPLTELTLDFFECYGTDGHWMGAEFAARLPPFLHGLPATLIIYAPDLEKRNEIERIIHERNL
ncbi:MAG: hypothetical protein LQ343_000460 [Gyalolechia ehrenbergii]|nr:MAG: hypothetical protein LQ343_000460 [Gyalolechia ehrenbergii]